MDIEDLEPKLKQALRREQPPAGFAERVLARAAARRRNRIVRHWMAIAATLIVALLVVTQVRQYQLEQRRQAAEKASLDLVFALKIASHKLHTTQRLIQRRGNGA